MRSFAVTALLLAMKQVLATDPLTIEKAGASITDLADSSVSLSLTQASTSVELTVELSFTLSGSLKFNTNPFATEESQVYVCLNDGTDHNCIVAKSQYP